MIELKDNHNGETFEAYNKLIYRICYGLTEAGKMDYSKPLYEFKRNCRCHHCNQRFIESYGVPNQITVTTDNKDNFPEIEKIISEYECHEKQFIGRKYISIIGGETTERIIR